MSLIERARHLTRPRSAATTCRKTPNSGKVANHEAPTTDGVMSGPGEIRNFSPLTLYTTQDGSYMLDGTLTTEDFSKINKERHNWERVDTFQTPYGHLPKGESRASTHRGWCDNEQEVVEADSPRPKTLRTPPRSPRPPEKAVQSAGWQHVRASPQKDVDIKIGPILCQDFSAAVADFSLAVHEMKSMLDNELSTGVSAVREAVTQAVTEISDMVGKTKTPNDLLPEIQAELMRCHRETRIGLESKVLKEIQKVNAESKVDIQEISNRLSSLSEDVAANSRATVVAADKIVDAMKVDERVSESARPRVVDEEPRLHQDPPVLQIIGDMKEAILHQGYRQIMPLTNQINELEKAFVAQNAQASAERRALLEAIAKIDRYTVDLNPVLETLDEHFAKMAPYAAPDATDINPTLLEALAKIDRPCVDLDPVLKAITDVHRTCNNAPVLAAIVQLDESRVVREKEAHALDEIRSALEFKPILHKFDLLESNLLQIHAGSELMLSRFEDMNCERLPKIEGAIEGLSKLMKRSIEGIDGVSKSVDAKSLKTSISEMTQKTETLSSALNAGLKKISKQLVGIEEKTRRPEDGGQLSPELEAISTVASTLDQLHEMQETILACLEKQEVSFQNRCVLPVAELSVCSPHGFTYTCPEVVVPGTYR